VWTSGQIDEYDITFWKALQNSCLGPKRMVFAFPRARAYNVRIEVELYSLCQRGVSEVVQPSFCFLKPCFCFRVERSVLAGRYHFQIEDGLKSISIKYMPQLPGPTANISSLSDKPKNLQKQKCGIFPWVRKCCHLLFLSISFHDFSRVYHSVFLTWDCGRDLVSNVPNKL